MLATRVLQKWFSDVQLYNCTSSVTVPSGAALRLARQHRQWRSKGPSRNPPVPLAPGIHSHPFWERFASTQTLRQPEDQTFARPTRMPSGPSRHSQAPHGHGEDESSEPGRLAPKQRAEPQAAAREAADQQPDAAWDAVHARGVADSPPPNKGPRDERRVQRCGGAAAAGAAQHQ